MLALLQKMLRALLVDRPEQRSEHVPYLDALILVSDDRRDAPLLRPKLWLLSELQASNLHGQR